MIVHLVDGTYELFRHFYGLRRFVKDKDPPYGGAIGVLNTVLQMIEGGATLSGVGILYRATLLPLSEDGATIDHVLGAANYRSVSAEEAATVEVTSRTHWL